MYSYYRFKSGCKFRGTYFFYGLDALQIKELRFNIMFF